MHKPFECRPRLIHTVQMTISGGCDTQSPCGAWLFCNAFADPLRRQLMSTCPKMRDADADDCVEIIRIEWADAHGPLKIFDGDVRFTQAYLENSTPLPSPSGVRVKCQGLLHKGCCFLKPAGGSVCRPEYCEHQRVTAIKARRFRCKCERRRTLFRRICGPEIGQSLRMTPSRQGFR